MSRKAGNRNRSPYKFLSSDHIGAADAENDNLFLSPTFFDAGQLSILTTVYDPRAIVVGRTGAGKTALLTQLYSYQDRVIKVDIDSMALSFIANNNTLNFYAELGVELDQFYKLLWRHVFIVEILRFHFKNDIDRLGHNNRELLTCVTQA